MSSKKDFTAFVGMMMAMAATGGQYPKTSESFDETSIETPEQRAERLLRLNEIRHRKMGLTKFQYGDQYVWALNKKCADKKAEKLGFIFPR